MVTSERDSHFANSAKELCNEIVHTVLSLSTEEQNIVDGCIMCNWSSAKVAESIAPLIAHYAYDLVLYALDTMNPISLQCYETTEEIIAREIPDMTELPSPEQS